MATGTVIPDEEVKVEGQQIPDADVQVEAAPAEKSFNERLTEVEPWKPIHSVGDIGKNAEIGLGNIGAGAISGAEAIPSMIAHPISAIENLPAGLLQMGKTALAGHPEYALGQAIPSMAAGEAFPRAVSTIRDIPEKFPTSEGIATSARTPKGALKPGVKTMAKIGGATIGGLGGSLLGHPEAGAVVGGLAGTSIADALIPKLPAVPEPELGSPENPGWVVRLPNRMPKMASNTPGAVGEGDMPGSVASAKGRLVQTPGEFAVEDQMQRIAEARAKANGMKYAAGMRPAYGGKVPRSAMPTMESEYPGPKEVIQFPKLEEESEEDRMPRAAD